MKILFKFLIFFTYLIFIFVVKQIPLFIFLILASIIIMKILKNSIKDFGKTLVFLIPFLILTFIFNLICGELLDAVLILIRLILAYIVTYIFSKLTPTSEIVYFVELITKPFCIFRVNNKKVGLIAGIGVSMIPVLKDEIEQKIYALKSKGYKIEINNLKIIFKPIFISILKRTGEIEKSLIAKGYQE